MCCFFNEIVQRTMKSANADEIKSVLSPDEVGFHHAEISSHWGGIYTVRKDGFSWKEPTFVYDKCGFFSTK